MPVPPDFPHLHLTFSGAYEPHFQGGPRRNPEIEANRDNPGGHANRIRGILGDMRQADAELRRLRAEIALPAIPADRGFLLRLPEGADVDQLVHALGVELVAETEEGLMLVSSVDLQFTELEEILREFETGTGGLVAGSSLLDIYERPDDQRRLKSILAPEVYLQWPLADLTTYVFDLGIQTATSYEGRDVAVGETEKGRIKRGIFAASRNATQRGMESGQHRMGRKCRCARERTESVHTKLWG